MRYNEMLRTLTPILTLKSLAMVVIAGETMDVPRFAARIAADTVNVTYLFNYFCISEGQIPFLPLRPILWIFGIIRTVPRYFWGVI